MSGVFAFHAVSPAGARLSGAEPAASAAALRQALEDRGLVVLDVRPAAARAGRGSAPGRGGGRQAVLEVTRALAALLEAGMPLTRALGIAQNVASGDVGASLPDVRARVERGETLADALAPHSALFSPLYAGMIRAGERSGRLAEAFARLTRQLERDEELRGRLLSASIYPLLLAGVGGVSVVVLLLFVIPRFTDLLEGAGAALLPSTRFLLSVSNGLRLYWPWLLGAAATGLALLAALRRTEGGRRATAHLFVRLPYVGSLRRQALAGRYARLLGVLLGGGAPLLLALEDTVKSLDDVLAREETTRIRARVREGASLHVAIGEGGLFPPLLPQLVAVGEESGRLQDFLLKAAEIFENGTERSLKRLVAFAEPVMIVVFGGLVAFVALSLLQAIYSVNADAFK
jgi:general secretion pathway protein F